MTVKFLLKFQLPHGIPGIKQFYSVIMRDITERKKAEDVLKEKARAELYGFIVSALPVFARGVPSQVRNNLVKNFAGRFENNIRPRFQEEMKRLGYGQNMESYSTLRTQIKSLIFICHGLQDYFPALV